MTLEPVNREDIIDNFTSQKVRMLPVKPRSKAPDMDEYKPYLSGEMIWDSGFKPEQNIGVICGKVSDGLFVIDIEKIHPEDYQTKAPKPRHIPCEESVIHQIIPNCTDVTFTTKTGSGSYHLLGKADRLPSKTSKFIYVKDDENIYQIDFKVTGQCVEASSIHENGNQYEMISHTKTIKRFDLQHILKRIEKIGFRPASKKTTATKIQSLNQNDYAQWDKDDLLKGGWVRGERRRKQKSLYCKIRRQKKTIGETKAVINPILDSLEDKLDQNEININYEDAEKFFQSDVLVEYGYAENQIDIIKLDNLTDIEKSEYAGKIVQVNAVISSNSIAYNVPKEFEARCAITEELHMCRGQTPIHVKLTCDKTVEFVDIQSEKRDGKMTGFVKGQFTKHCTIRKKQLMSITLQKFKIRPIISSLYKKEKNFFDDDGNKWASYDIFIENNDDTIDIEAGKEVEIVGLVMADPKSQKVTLYAHSMTALNENEFDAEKVRAIHERFKSRTVTENMDWLTSEFEKYSRIIKRRNVAEMGFLTFFSPLYINFEGLNIPSWVKSLAIGDSTVGKSETVRKLIILLKAGQIVSGEMATVAGLAGAAVQASGGQWFVDYGVLPMQDRKLLAIDGAHILRQEELAKLAEAERNGKIEIMKAAKGEAYARTRQIKIMNPVDDDMTTTMSMNSFFYPVKSLTNNFHIQSIARIDFACFVSDDVSAADRNVQGDIKYDPLLEDMSELLRLVWSMKYTVEFTDKALDEILKQSTELENKFKTESIPLISNDQKYKLAKLSASLACVTCSFNDTFDVVTVTDEHVRYVSNLITEEYHKAGLDEIVKQTRHGKVDLGMLYQIIDDIGSKINNNDKEEIIRILQWIAETGKFPKEELQEHFDLSRDSQLKPLIGYLADEKIIKRGKTGFTVLRFGTEIGRFIVNFSNSSNSRAPKTDTPLNNTNQKKEGVSLLDLLEELERRKTHTFRCNDCNTEWPKTKQSLEDLQEWHNEGKLVQHEIVEIFKDPAP